MTVVSIRYQPIEGGALGGHFALHVTLGGDHAPGVSMDSMELGARIYAAFEKLDLKFKAIRGVLFDCRKSNATNEEMSTLLGTLRDWGMTVILWVGQSIRHPWFEFGSYLTVFVTGQHWPNFKVSEIRYVMPIDNWVEPEIYDVNTKVSSYLIPPREAKSADVLTFVTSCTRPWAIIGKSPALAFALEEGKS